MDQQIRTRLIIDVLAGHITPSEAGEILGITADEVLAQKALYLDGAAHATARTAEPFRLPRRFFHVVAPLAAMAAFVGFVGVARSQPGACTQTLPAPMVTFCPQAPARAGEINGNFQQLVTWVQGKIGTLSAPGVTTTAVTATTVNATTVSATTVSAPTMAATNVGTTNLEAQRVTSGAYTPPYANWGAHGLGAGGAGIYNDGNSYDRLMLVGNDAGGGGRRRVGVWDDLHVNGRIYGTLGRSSCSWVNANTSHTDNANAGDFYNTNGNWATTNTNYRHHVAVCGDGQYMAGWSCFATEQIDGNCRAYCCTP